jgi:mannose-1-phosphate guanylyltransferase
MSIGTTPTPVWSDALETEAGTLPGEELVREHLLAADAEMWAIVLAGGIGSRFWPLSSKHRPKQLLRLVGDRPMIADTVGRLHPTVPAERVLVITSLDIAPAIHAAIPEVPTANMLVEPRPLGTAAALAWGVQEISRRAGPNTLITTLHADLAVGFPDLFRHSLRHAAGIASQNDVIASIGVHATRNESGFGYLVPGSPLSADDPISEGGAAIVEKFIEKPDADTVADLVARGCLWHSGIFVARATIVLEAIRQLTPEISVALEALELGDHDRFALEVRSISLERGLLERSDNLVVVPGEFGWDDVGTWASCRRARELDDDGNGAIGDVHFVESSGNVVHAEGGTVVMYGVEGLLVVTLPGITFVTTIDRAADLKPLLDALPDNLRKVGTRAMT